MMDEETRTLWCGNLSEKVTEEILFELFLQGGPVQRVCIPRDRDGKQKAYGFVTYKHINSVLYALELFDGTSLFNRRLNICRRKNENLPQINYPQNQSIDFNQLLQLGQEMSFGSNIPCLKADLFGMNMLPSTDSHRRQTSNDSYTSDRRSRRVHPYYREESKASNHYKDHNSRSHSNHKTSDSSRHDYKRNKRSYR
ncbi:uncharacterized protein LOC143427903 [Xylocopa sonorina]|uniref:uncharacterized protein LOC143427903 n=1 Tax=Xylocopa sonorina TaxID=1818115 RepID=UPI00403AEDF1